MDIEISSGANLRVYRHTCDDTGLDCVIIEGYKCKIEDKHGKRISQHQVFELKIDAGKIDDLVNALVEGKKMQPTPWEKWQG